MSRAEELKLDIQDLQALIQQAQRQRAKDVLGIEVRKLETELSKIAEPVHEPEKVSVSSSNSSTKCYEVKLNNYAWDQSDKFVKIYVSLDKVNTLGEGAVNCDFGERSLDLRVIGLENHNYQLPINNLCEEIDPARSYVKVKTNTVVIFLAKKITDKHWSHVTGVEKRIKEAKSTPPQTDKNQDPEGTIMNLMKKMYQEGDDEMKKIIAKAWTENQDPSKSSLPNLPSV